ncbi:MAG: type II secretion system protein GspL [Burkholderiaceae bacterium]
MITLTLALALPRPTPSTEFSYALRGEGQSTPSHGVAPLSLLPRADALVLVVPARALSWHALRLPPVASGRMRAALEGALEEKLLDEPANLAFALGPYRDADGRALVASCDKTWLRAALQFFEAGQRPATRVVPAFDPAREAAQRRLVVIGTEQDAWLTLVDMHAVLCVPLAAAPALLNRGASASPAEELPLLAEPAVAELAEQQLGRAPSILEPAEALRGSSESAWELAQFDLALSSGGRLARRWAQAWQQLLRAPAWRPARWGLLALAVANLVGLNAWAWHQDSLLQTRRQQVRGVLSQAFPQVRTIVDAPLQMERELALLRKASGGVSKRDLEVMLSALGAALPTGSSPTAIDYSAGELRLRGSGLDAGQVALVDGKLASLGYSARLDGEQLLLRVQP